MFLCPKCQNPILAKEYMGVYRCGYCHIWLRENEVIKYENISNIDRTSSEVSEIKDQRRRQPETSNKFSERISLDIIGMKVRYEP